MSTDKNKLIPELRFPEFLDEGEWMEKKLGDIGDFIGGGTPDTTVEEYWSGSIQWYTPTEVKDGILKDSSRKITGLGLKNSSTKLLPEGTILITTRATIGDIAIAKEECCTNQGFQSLVVFNSEINSFWFYWILQHKKELIRRSSGSTFKEIGKNEIIHIPTLSPNKSEQQKIASCLSSLDEVIAVHSQKLATLKDHKKGLMQNLFPTNSITNDELEITNVPNYRFPEFMEDEGWVVKDLGVVLGFIMGNAFKSNDFVENGVQLIRMGNLYQGVLQLNRIPVFLPHNFVKEYQQFLVKPRDLLMSMTGTLGKRDYGFVLQIPENSPDLLLNQRVIKLVPKEGYIKEFVLQLFKNEPFLQKLYSIPGGTKQANLSTKDLKAIKISFPKLIEQQKIASCLSSLDDLITAQTEKIAQLKLHKKGLMQGLFPRSITN